MTVKLVEMYEDLAKKVWDRMVGMVGIHAVTILVQRAVWITGDKYEEASNIKFDENGITFGNISEGYDEAELKLLLEEFFGTLVMILARLVGKEMAIKIVKDLDESYLTGRE